MSRPHTATGRRGFTLIELLMVVGIISILATLSLGYSGTFIADSQQRELARATMAGLGQARAEAMRRGTRVMMGVASGALISFIDANANYKFDPGEVSVFRFPNTFGTYIQPSLNITSPQLMAGNPGGNATAIFDFSGFSQNASGQPQAAVLCIRTTVVGLAPRAVQLTIAGASRILNGADAVAQCP